MTLTSNNAADVAMVFGAEQEAVYVRYTKLALLCISEAFVYLGFWVLGIPMASDNCRAVLLKASTMAFIFFIIMFTEGAFLVISDNIV